MKRIITSILLCLGVGAFYSPYPVPAKICTHVSSECELEITSDPGEYCCLSVGGTPCEFTEDVTQAYMIPIIGVQCGNLRQNFIYPCAFHVGYCGNIQCSTECEEYGSK